MAQESITGRKKETALLDKIWNSKEAEFLALYGRRRVGKTHLIRSYFSEKALYFEITGIRDAKVAVQLENFAQKLSALFYGGAALCRPKSWLDAFLALTDAIKRTPKNKKIVLFLDELPWLASRRSGVVQALDYYWNTEWSKNPNLIVVVCGSAASWMLDHVINAKGGLHNRTTMVIRLEPFNLYQTQEFLRSRNIRYNPAQVLDLYMVTGGIAHYLKQVERGKSVLQNIDALCFRREGLLYSEFERLFRSLFDKADIHLSLVREISKRRYGISRPDLLKALKLSSGGTLSKRIEELEAAGFVKSFIPYGHKKRDLYYRLVDEYAQFYLQWIEPVQKHDPPPPGYWEKMALSPSKASWAGLAFEAVCFKHLEPIRDALGLKNILHKTGWWNYSPKKGQEGAQVDLLFDRSDGVVSLCEIKYSSGPFVVDKAYSKILMNKIRAFEHFMPSKTASMTLISTRGSKLSVWAKELIENEVLLDQLFK